MKHRVETEKVRKKSIGWLLKVSSSLFHSQLKIELELLGFSLDQFAVIMTLLEKDDINQVDISKSIRIPSYTITRTLDVLEKNSYIKRSQDKESRRSLRVHITEKGRALSSKLFAIINKVNNKMTQNLSKEEVNNLHNTLNKLIT